MSQCAKTKTTTKTKTMGTLFDIRADVRYVIDLLNADEAGDDGTRKEEES